MRRNVAWGGVFLGVFLLLFAMPLYAADGGNKLKVRAFIWTGHETYRLDVVEKWKKFDKPIMPSRGERIPPLAGMPFREVSIRCIEDCRKPLAFRDEVPDSILSAFTLHENDKEFVTIWVGATAYWVRVYRVEKNRVAKVMEEASKSYPLFVSDRDGEKLIVLDNPYNHIKPDMRTVAGQFWKYRGGKYVPAK